MPEISRFYGIKIKMYYREHNPPHFHMEYQGYKATIEIHTGIVGGKMPKTAIKLVLKWLEEHKNELVGNWIKSEQKKKLNPIDPLT